MIEWLKELKRTDPDGFRGIISAAGAIVVGVPTVILPLSGGMKADSTAFWACFALLGLLALSVYGFFARSALRRR